jgi:membrane-bound lytic murein transglycosylase D
MRGVYPTAAALILLLAWPAPAFCGEATEPGNPPAAMAETTPKTPPEPHGYGPFELPDGLLPRVKFWVEIYSKVYSWQFAIHDTEYPQLVYTVFNNKGKPKRALNREKLRVVHLLAGLVPKAKLIAAGKLRVASLRPEEARIYEVFVKNDLLRELPEAASAKRVRAQAGLRDSLEDALFISGRYLSRMETVFRHFDLPEEIAYLPFVESGFNKKAVSKVGASGIWQFMPYTGKLYLRVDDVVDERNDPMRAAEAAARLMRQNKDLLGEWPLAITAYNHGAMGMARAVKETGSTNIVDIINHYESKTFGFASQNFYASFLAALHVAKNSEAYLGAIPRAKKLEFDEFVMPNYMDLNVFLTKIGIDPQAFRDLNPALTQEVYSGRKYIPVGYTVRIPMAVREEFFAKYDAIPAAYKMSEQKRSPDDPAPSAAATAEASPEAAGLVTGHKKE